MTAPSEPGISPGSPSGPPVGARTLATAASAGRAEPPLPRQQAAAITEAWAERDPRRDATSAADLLGLTVDAEARRGAFVAAPHLLNARRTLWGGCGLAAAIAFAQACGARECVWAQAQFVGPVHAGATVELRADGGALSQAAVRATAEGRTVFRAGGTFGRATGAVTRFAPSGSWAPDPLDCPPREYPAWLTFPRDGVLSLVEQRWARPPRTVLDGTPGTGRSALWLRLVPPLPLTGAALALLADFTPVGLIEAIGDMSMGTSLDNQLRVIAAPVGEWILLDVRVEAIVRNVAQLRARMYDAAGALVATAGQAALVHRVRPPGDAVPGQG
ncbi:acyl-CoA thioesterase domain-containing protein [Frankia sp. AgB32]|uniref:acyl-CoA thioesterase domain-containing protein n=1 Tax=Frankia sp. AgB32 TaxID=631119 RepID=UPI00200F494E|nr:acyl-CoA thioesterase domain-containing protein [Frankia sp. AgB32]MCK9895834.1 thioesterase family protein [Frankia sp. AgB32]